MALLNNHHSFRGAGFLLLLSGLLLSGLLSPQSAEGSPGLMARDLRAEGAILRMFPVRQKKGTALMVVTAKKTRTGTDPEQPGDLILATLRDHRLFEIARWEAPKFLRWIEPLSFSDGERGWLALIGSGWFLGREKSGKPDWKPLCECQSIFTEGHQMLPHTLQLVMDLDGDGQSEILLPHWDGLDIYRIDQKNTKLIPQWRFHWNIREHYDLANTQIRVSLEIPRYVLRDYSGDGVQDFMMIMGNHLLTAVSPRRLKNGGQPFFVITPEKLAQWRRDNLPADLKSALLNLTPKTHVGQEAFQKALQKAAGPAKPLQGTSLRKALELTREDQPTLFPEVVPLSNLGQPEEKESFEIHSIDEMDGDGIPDLIHMISTRTGSILDQKNQFRWYRGNRNGTSLSFPGKPQLLFSEGPAFAKLVFPKRGSESHPYFFLATADVSLMAIIKAFTLNSATLDLMAYRWNENRVTIPPMVHASLSFRLKNDEKKNRPLLVLADLDGDGWREFLVNQEVDTLTAYRGSGKGPELRGDPLFQKPVALPLKTDTIFVHDLDGDGREEIILWYAREKDPLLHRTLRVLEYADTLPGDSIRDGQ